MPQWNPTAALVVEIVSPCDDTWGKLAFYAAHRYRPNESSRILGISGDELCARLDWST